MFSVAKPWVLINNSAVEDVYDTTTRAIICFLASLANQTTDTIESLYFENVVYV